MNSHPNAKLIDIVENKRDDFQPEAVAAAELVLKNRNVKFKTPEPVEIIPMTVDEIREEVEARKKAGESMQSIKMDFRSKGVDLNKLDDALQDENEKRSWKIRRNGFIIGGILVIGGFLVISITPMGFPMAMLGIGIFFTMLITNSSDWRKR
ncbi:MAG TPA: hypothetical protein VL651_03745 [Bacteroidia bacterium]|nr:hypothetical protein [Bacteroidia bacterium]